MSNEYQWLLRVGVAGGGGCQAVSCCLATRPTSTSIVISSVSVLRMLKAEIVTVISPDAIVGKTGMLMYRQPPDGSYSNQHNKPNMIHSKIATL